MIGVVVIPTGIGAEIGGHAGDGNPVARLFGAICNTVITHPNVVNASDINEMPPNTLYVEGSALTRFLQGKISLVPSKKPNKILVVANQPLKPETINAVSAARVTLGANVELLELEEPLILNGWLENNLAAGSFSGHESLLKQISDKGFDALAITSPVSIAKDVGIKYLRDGGANPWGKAEALLSECLATKLNKPVAHAPISTGEFKDFNEVVDPRKAPEMISVCYLHSVLKGLHLAPKLGGGKGLLCGDVDFMVTPYDCWGDPHEACKTMEITVISVRENMTLAGVEQNADIVVENYWEAAGVVMSWKAGIVPESVRRPITETEVGKP